ncbi:MAG: DUF1697 domain-containing protein [Myxococcaceae bacterium]|nr:DUF1697 domain-containing protein [Myxococcaceae bacterium]
MAKPQNGEALVWFAALLRGINLGKRRIPMPRLAKMFEEAGGRDARTYVASGNVVFRAPPREGEAIAKKVEAAIRDEFGFDAPIVVRTHEELVAAARANPWAKQAASAPKAVHVVFLPNVPAAADVKRLDPDRSPGDQLVVKGREVHLFVPKGMADTRFTPAWMDATLKMVTTARNWNTVQALIELTAPATSDRPAARPTPAPRSRTLSRR